MRPGFINSFQPARDPPPPGLPPIVHDFRHVSGQAGVTIPVTESTGLFTGGPTAQGNTTGWPIGAMMTYPLFIGRMGATIDSLGVSVAGASVTASIARMGIYRCDPPSARDRYPKGLVQDFGDIVLNGVSPSQQRNTATAPLTLTNGLYYIAFKLGSGDPNLDFADGVATDCFSGLIIDGGFNIFTASNIMVTGVPAGPLPATFPAGGVLTRSSPIYGVNFGV